MTAPYSSELTTLLSGPLEHYYRVEIHPKTGDSYELPTDEGSMAVTFSEDWSPHVQARWTGSIPALAELDALDGRAGCRVKIHAGYILPSRVPDVHLLADLALQDRDVSRPANTVPLSADSDEIRLQDRKERGVGGPHTWAGLNEAVDYILGVALSPDAYTIDSDFPAGYRSDVTTGVEIWAGDDYQDIIADLAASADAWIYCDGSNTWRIRSRPTVGGTPVHTMATGPGGTITDSKTTLSRREWFNDVVIRYRWKNGTGEQDIFGRASITSGPHAVAAVGYKTMYVSKGTGTTQARANSAARSMVSNLSTRGRGMTLTGAAAYWLRPGDTITVQLPTGDPEDHIVRSVTFRPDVGLMDVTTRQPLDLIITTGE